VVRALLRLHEEKVCGPCVARVHDRAPVECDFIAEGRLDQCGVVVFDRRDRHPSLHATKPGPLNSVTSVRIPSNGSPSSLCRISMCASGRAVTRSMGRSRPSLQRCAGQLTNACELSMQHYRGNGSSARLGTSGSTAGRSGIDAPSSAQSSPLNRRVLSL